MKNINLFSSHLFVKNVGTEEQKQDLKNQILSAKDNNVGYIPSGNKKCWRSGRGAVKQNWSLSSVSPSKHEE